ncbi:hypothetical protein KNT87_gp239 [Erwinia phage Cronus]|uniref:Uncharacterized protein n=1 Tax=Erwinia phage Cronus TaxID=2163633 RepID=A0A2S1GLS3_9CAUD|nr:hypothetical protein KNT87_gp239 [Erwinia phage Cronus]AWD90330.1 hypothetical protein [Erwinia phage Cronus]
MIGDFGFGDDRLQRCSTRSETAFKEVRRTFNESSKAFKARQTALDLIENGVNGILDRIYAQIDAIAALGKFEASFLIKASDAHFESKVTESLRSEGFTVERSEDTSYQRGGITLKIKW